MKSRFYAVLVLLAMLAFSFAQSVPSASGFDELALTPPPPPSSNTSQSVAINLELREYGSRALLTDMHVLVDLIKTSDMKKVSTLAYVGSQGQIHLRLDAGEYELILHADDAKTYAGDYHSDEIYSFYINANKTIYLNPIGSVRGAVYSEDGKALAKASVKLDCASVYFKPQTLSTDEYGTYKVEDVPAGPCRASSVMGNHTGFADVEIKRGEISKADITLFGTIENMAEKKEEFSIYAYLYAGIVVIAIILAGYYFEAHKPMKNAKLKKLARDAKSYSAKKISNKQKKIESHPLPVAEKKSLLPKKAPDIMKTLSENECSVVNYICENGGHSSQAKIKNALFIPKTTLARLLMSLEKKNIVEIKKSGKLKRVEFTKWFISE